MILIISAIKLEISGLLKIINGKRIPFLKNPEVYEGYLKNKKVTIIICGTGKSNAINASQFIISGFLKSNQYDNIKIENIEKILIAGVSGALIEELNTGDLVICNMIVNTEFPEPSLIKQKDYAELDTLGFTNIPADYTDSNKISYLSLGTVNKILTGYEEKKHFRDNFDVQLVDMESYWIIKYLLPFKIPILCIRSIIDNLNHNLPEFFGSLTFKNLRDYFRILLFIFKSPFNAKKILVTARNFRKACKNLNLFIESIL